MANDKNKKTSNSDKITNTMKKSVVSGSCKPCMPIERNGTNKEKCTSSKNASEENTSTKNPSVTDISNVASCYKKCTSTSIQKDSSCTPCEAAKPTGKPSDLTTTVGSCYSKCGPPSVQQCSSSTSSGTAATTSGPDQCKSQTKQEDSANGSGSCKPKPLSITNPYVEKMDEDILYHIALGNKSHDLPNMFGDVKFVIMGSTPKRMEQFAYFMANQMRHELPPGTILNDISKNSHRYAMFKVGPILSVSHGMGTPSIGILLHELIKLMSHAGVKDPTFLRIGTCGGFNKKAGTVVVSNKVVNDFMESFYELTILGKKVRFPANLDQTVVNEILSSSEQGDKFETVAGATYCTDNFYEGSGRADGAICEFSQQEGLNYYKELQQKGVVNIEMESLAFAAFTCRAGIKSAVVTVILSDRLETDQIKQSKEVLDEWQIRPQRLLANYIKKKLSISDLPGSCRGSTSTTNIPASNSTTEATMCKSCGATVGSTDTCSIGNTTSTTTTRRYSTTACNSTRCEPCGGTGVLTNGTANKLDTRTSTAPSSDPIACKSYGGYSSSTSGTSTCKPVTPGAPVTCKSCGGTGVAIQSSTSTSTMKPIDTAYSTSAGSTFCKPCVGVTSSKTTDCGTTKNPTDSTSSTTSDPTICKTCQGTGTDESAKDATKPTSLAPKCIGSNFDSSSSTIKPGTAPCKSCMGSGKTNCSTTTIQSTISTTGSTDMVMCKCCRGAGVVPITKTDDEMIPTIRPFFASDSSQAKSVCKPCLKLSDDNNQTVCSSTAAPGNCTSTTTPRSTSSASSAVGSNICKPCLPIGSSTTAAPFAGGSNVCKPCLPIGSSTTAAPSAAGSNVCKPCLGIGSSTTAAPAGGSNVCKPCLPIGSSTTAAPSAAGSNVCKPCLGIGSSTTASASTTSAPCQKSSTTTDASLESKTKGSADVCKPCVGTATVGSTCGTTTLKPAAGSTTSAFGVCKPCVGSANLNTACGTTTSTPGSTTTTSQSSFSTDGLCKLNTGSTTSCTTTSGTSTVKPGNGSTTKSCLSSDGLNKQDGGKTTSTTGGTSTCKPGSNPPTSQSAYSSGGSCKPCGGSTSTCGTSTTAPCAPCGTSTTAPCAPCGTSTTAPCAPCGTSTTAPCGTSTTAPCAPCGTSTTAPCAPCGTSTTAPCAPCGTSATAPCSTSTAAPYATSTTTEPCASIEGLCKRFQKNSTIGTTGGTSTCKPGNNPPTSQPTSTDRPCNSTTNTPNTTTTAQSSSPFGVCKPCSGGSSTTSPFGVCKPCSGGSSTASPFGVCKPCSGGSTTMTPACGLAGQNKSTSQIESATENSTTTVAYEISKSSCKSKDSMAQDDTKSTSQPTVNSCTSKTNLDVTNCGTGTTTTTCEPKRPKCVPYTCYTADKTDTTPLPTTPKTYLAKDFDSSSNSTISNDSCRSCYQKCSSKAPSSEGGALCSTKPPVFQTPEQDNMKGVPPALGPCCSTSDTVEFREVPNAQGPACASCNDQKDSTESLSEKSSSMCEVKTESSTGRRPSMGQVKTEATMDRRPSMGQVKTEATMDRRPSMGQVKPESTIDRRPSMGQVKTESTMDRRPSMGQVKTESSDRRPSMGQVKTESSMDRRPSMGHVKTESSMDRRPSMGHVNTESLLEKRPSFDSTASSNDNQAVDYKAGPCCTGRNNGVTPSSVSSNGNVLGSCCSGKSVQPQDVTSSRPIDSKSAGGGLCSGNETDSPDEPCDARGKVKTTNGTDSKSNGCPSLEKENGTTNLDESRGCSKKSQASNNNGTDSKPTASGSSGGKVNGCPINIDGPCIFKKDDEKSQCSSTPKPSPDTPDTATLRAMPAFVTPTPPSSSSKGIIGYSKFTNNNGVLITSFVNKEANKYDESPSPCAACKKFQESKTNTGATPTDSQPKIIKCPHKLKRLKDECQGYD